MQAIEVLPFSVARAIKTAGEGRLRVRARAPGCDWGRLGAESAVVSVYLNGMPNAELVLHGGDTWTDYEVALGPLPVGMAQLTLKFRPELSPRGATEVVVENAWIDTISPSHPDYLLWRYAPRLYGRPDNASTDTPLMLLARVTPEGPYLRLAYAFVWSDQDTGEDVATRLAKTGTTTDIDWVYELYHDRRKASTPKAVVQGAGTKTDPIRGRFVGGHPLLHTSTRNNMVSPEGSSPLLFALPPTVAYSEAVAPRERALDLAPWAIALSTKEILRGGKSLGFDPRNFLYLDFYSELPLGGLLAAEVTLRDKRVFTSDQGTLEKTVSRSGWNRIAVALPSPGELQQILQVRLVRRDNQPRAHRIWNATVYQLGESYRPTTLPIRVA